jgi:hypothetical protein
MEVAMSLSQKILRRGAATSAVVLAFSAMAPAFADDAGLINDSKAVIRYGVTLSKTMAAVTGDDLARGRAGGFMVDLETALKAPASAPQVVVYPKQNSTNMLVIAAVTQPAGFSHLDIPLCAQQNNRVIYTGVITQNGEVKKLPWDGPISGEEVPGVGTKPACGAFISAARNEFKKLAQSNAPSQQQAEQKTVSKPSASLATATPNG